MNRRFARQKRPQTSDGGNRIFPKAKNIAHQPLIQFNPILINRAFVERLEAPTSKIPPYLSRFFQLPRLKDPRIQCHQSLQHPFVASSSALLRSISLVGVKENSHRRIAP